MVRPSIAIVVLVLALSAVAVAGAVVQENAGSAAPVVGTTPGEPNHLAINESEVARSNATTLNLDVGSAVSADSSSIQASYVTLRFEAAYENASTEETRSQVLAQFRARLGNRTTALEARDRANIGAYASGSITTDRFLRERARIQSRATQLHQSLSDITGGIESEFNGVDGRLEVLQGPVSSTAADDLVGPGNGQSIYLEVSDSGYTLASVSGSEYTRETYLDDARYPEQPDQLANGTSGLTAAQNRAMELYPWVRANQANISSTFPRGPGLYRVNKGFPGGEMSVYLSGGTTDVFREHQTRSLDSIDTTQAINRTDDSVRLTVNRSFETGPAEIRLLDTATDTPINGTVAVGDRDRVWTGEDGRLWVVEPRGGVQLNATAGTTRFSTSLSGS